MRDSHDVRHLPARCARLWLRAGAYYMEPIRKLCSMRCMHITARLEGMIDPNKHEVNALASASRMGGEYIDSIAKTDLASWSDHEWATLIEVVVTAFQDHLREAYSDDPPF